MTTTTKNLADLAEAIEMAMADYLENEGSFTPHGPAIVRNEDGDGYEFSSTLLPHAGVVWDLQEGFGAWTPHDFGDDLSGMAAAAAAMIAREMDAREMDDE